MAQSHFFHGVTSTGIKSYPQTNKELYVCPCGWSAWLEKDKIEMLDEKWVPVEGFPNYAVSNYGEVINVKTNRTLSENKCKDGRRRVVLYRNGIPNARMVNRLVAEAFFLNYQDGIEVNHINGDYGDCSVLNLTIGQKACRKRNEDE